LLENNPAVVFRSLEEIFAYGMELKRFAADLLGCFRALILCKIQGCDDLLDISEQELALFQELAGTHSTQTIHQKLTLLMQGFEEMRYANQPRLLMETVFLKVIQSGDVVPVTALLSRLDDLLAGGAGEKKGQVQEGTHKGVLPVAKKKEPLSSTAAPVIEQKTHHTQAVETSLYHEESVSLAENIEQPGLVGLESGVSVETDASDNNLVPLPQPQGDPDESPAASPRLEPHQRDVRRDWMAFIAYVRERSVWMAQDLQRADSVKEQGRELLLQYDDPVNCSMLRKDVSRKTITEYVLDFFQKELSIRFLFPSQSDEMADDGQESPLKERRLLANDPLVLMAAEIFNGQIGDIRVGSRFRQ
jgi:DNA polymerase-3 subunit gamma/tau